MNNEIIKLMKISKKFVGANKNIIVLKNINLKINKGEIVSLSGPSGSGKSTLLHIIALLDQPSSGEIFFKNKNFSKSTEKEKDSVRKKGRRPEPISIRIPASGSLQAAVWASRQFLKEILNDQGSRPRRWPLSQNN